MDYAAGGSALEWTHVMDETEKLDFDTIIPGHGPVSDRAGLKQWRVEFLKIRDRIHGMVKKRRIQGRDFAGALRRIQVAQGRSAIGQVDAFIAEMKTDPLTNGP